MKNANSIAESCKVAKGMAALRAKARTMLLFRPSIEECVAKLDLPAEQKPEAVEAGVLIVLSAIEEYDAHSDGTFEEFAMAWVADELSHFTVDSDAVEFERTLSERLRLSVTSLVTRIVPQQWRAKAVDVGLRGIGLALERVRADGELSDQCDGQDLGTSVVFTRVVLAEAESEIKRWLALPAAWR